MKVRALRDHFHESEFRKEGEEFDYVGRAHKHIEPVSPKDKKAFDEDLKKVTAEQARKKAEQLAKGTPIAVAALPPAAPASVDPPAPASTDPADTDE